MESVLAFQDILPAGSSDGEVHTNRGIIQVGSKVPGISNRDSEVVVPWSLHALMLQDGDEKWGFPLKISGHFEKTYDETHGFDEVPWIPWIPWFRYPRFP